MPTDPLVALTFGARGHGLKSPFLTRKRVVVGEVNSLLHSITPSLVSC